MNFVDACSVAFLGKKARRESNAPTAGSVRSYSHGDNYIWIVRYERREGGT